MVFDNIYPVGVLEEELGKLAGAPVARVPFADCQERTSYYVSRDGRSAFVGVEFGGYVQIKRVKIYEAGYRSANSSPSFKRRNKYGTQCATAIPSAVYGAFVLRDRMPNFKLRHIDGCIANSGLDNLALADENQPVPNMQMLAPVYRRCYRDFVRYFCWRYNLRRELVEDFVSDAFVNICLSPREIRLETADRLWWFRIKQELLTYTARNRLIYEVYDLAENYLRAKSDAETDAETLRRSLWDEIPPKCRSAVGMVSDGYSQYEIAKEMGVSQSWISILLKETRKALNNALSHDK